MKKITLVDRSKLPKWKRETSRMSDIQDSANSLPKYVDTLATLLGIPC